MATPRFGELADDLVDALLVADVDADRRAVEDQQLGLRREPFGEHDALLIAARERLRGILRIAGANAEPIDPGEREFCPPRRRNEPDPAAQTVERGQRDVIGDRLAQVEAEREPILGDIGDAGADRVLVGAQAQRRALDQDLAGVEPRHAEKRERQLGPPAPEEPDQAQHFAAHGSRRTRRRTRRRGSRR